MKKKEKRDLESQLRTPIYDRETHTRPRDFLLRLVRALLIKHTDVFRVSTLTFVRLRSKTGTR